MGPMDQYWPHHLWTYRVVKLAVARHSEAPSPDSKPQLLVADPGVPARHQGVCDPPVPQLVEGDQAEAVVRLGREEKVVAEWAGGGVIYNC